MSKITCDMCMDLIPLVKDGVASEDSCQAVHEHLAECDACSKVLYQDNSPEIVMNDQIVVSKIKKQLIIITLAIMLAGTSFGLWISDSMNIFYNALILPAIGALGYLLLKKKAYLLSVGVFLFTMGWTVIRELINGILESSDFKSLFLMSFGWSIIYVFFIAIGTVIAWLFSYAFRKEKKEN
ncbi:MAG: zf-HC2 domain-containing protein [Mobilitalea sp.]